jgi:hypothetical protein
MRGMGQLTELLGGFLANRGIVLPAWGAPAVALVVGMLLLPRLLRIFRIGRARRILKGAWLLQADDRAAAEGCALALVRKDCWGLISIAEEAHRQGRHRLAASALQAARARASQGRPSRNLRRQLRELARRLEPARAPSVDEVVKAAGSLE